MEGGVGDVLNPLLLPPAAQLLVSSSRRALLVVLRVLEMREGGDRMCEEEGTKRKGL